MHNKIKQKLKKIAIVAAYLHKKKQKTCFA